MENQVIKDIINNSDIFTFKDIMNVNHKPHPYTIGPKHIAYASDHHGGLLGQETLDKVPCYVLGCQLSYDEHTSDKVLFLQLKRHATPEEASALFVNPELKAELEKEKIAGVSFIETDEKFRIA